MAKYYFYPVVFFLLSCTTGNDANHVSRQSYPLDFPIYGKLVEGVNGYYFASFSTARKPGPWVNLKTNRPAWNTQPVRCGKGLVKDRNDRVPDCAKVVGEHAPFMEGNFDEIDAAVRVLIAPLFMGTSLTGVSYDVSFNRKAYSDASLQAFEKLDLATHLHDINTSLTFLRSEAEYSGKSDLREMARTADYRLSEDERAWVNYEFIEVEAQSLAALVEKLSLQENDLKRIIVNRHRLEKSVHQRWRAKSLLEEQAELERRQEQVAARRQLEARVRSYQVRLKSGDSSHCGLVVEVKESVVLVQTMIGPTWLKRSELYPDSVASCRFRNGVYQPPTRQLL